MWVQLNVDDEEWSFQVDGGVVPQIGEAFEVETNGSARSLRLVSRNIVYASDVVGGGSCIVSLIAEEAQETSIGSIPSSPEETSASLLPEGTVVHYEFPLDGHRAHARA